MKKITIFSALATAIILSTLLMCAKAPSDQIHVYSNENNDLYQLLVSNKINCVRYDQIETALEKAKENETLLILARNYPEEKTNLPESFFNVVEAKQLKVYVEFPDRLKSGKTGKIQGTKKERLIVTSDFFGKELPSMSIMDAGLYSYLNIDSILVDSINNELNTERSKSLIRGANVAGFKNAVYGLEDTPNFPILFVDNNVLISTTKLSDFIKGRYSPYATCQNIVGGILSYLFIDIDKIKIKWEATVKPTYNSSDELSADAYQSAVKRGTDWYINSKFLFHPEWKERYSTNDVKTPGGPPVHPSLPSGDGSLGVMEGHYSFINPDGSQPYRYWLRADCVAETAMTFAVANNIEENPEYIEISTNLMDFLLNTDVFKTEESKDPSKSSYGLIGWADTHKEVYYGDDNARVLIGAILTSQTLGNTKWDKQIAELILANFRTSNKKGFRNNALRGNQIEEKTWPVLMDMDFENIAPHYESWLWATYIWLYDKTGYKPLLDKAKKAIEISMTNYPDNWKWTNGLQQERARMILPLAWLVRVENNEENRGWLNSVIDDLLEHQVACGALREELGKGVNGKYDAPFNNKNYGTTEAPLIHINGDPVADMLYTSNFAFFALNEAAQATQDPKYLESVDKLADFMVRIQSTSSGRADLDGCWFRAFDFDDWEFYGANADFGWGPWGTLTGWTQSFITTTLAMKMNKTSFWEITKDSKVGSDIDSIWSQMLPSVKH